MAPPTRRALLGGLAGTLAAPGLPRAAPKILRFAYQRSSTLLTLLKTNGTLEQRLAAKGFGVSWHLFTSVIEPMNAGSTEFHADVADAVPIFTQAAGAPLTFYAKEDASPAAEAIIVPADSPIRSVQDLKGRTVGVSRGSGCHFLLAAALKRAGLSFAEIRPAYLNAPDGAAAFERRSLDAWVIWDPFLAIVQAKAPVRVITDATGYSSYNRYYSVQTAFAQARPDVVGVVYDALVEAGRWVKGNPREAAARLAPLWGDVPVPIVETVNARRSYAVRPVLREGLAEQQVIADTFHEAGLIPRPIDAASVPLWSPETGG
ncbi:aliphatic sulfonates family ABC transporter, periplsmic ligand-binding protein [Methylobacterium sp. 4-46]|uniref:ABC transporter substrate-binding protein n=1 Tax=unclassified Methylobacterium TaxID=2615210 RepID=UPI000152DB8D|nr:MULTISPECIES: ABC transporter substrate-binding protein [Methylobacterium]ACA16095.1 aliphatic sulfonates family ABC transporter, periplsmic ligand-binding protein [Methylobacterium sp. 4-46]WFT81806.1 ABC transporter substrate-binding protein [Methylobacterium nodulans]